MDNLIITTLCSGAALALIILAYREGRRRGRNFDALEDLAHLQQRERRLRQEVTHLRFLNGGLQRAAQKLREDLGEVVS